MMKNIMFFLSAILLINLTFCSDNEDEDRLESIRANFLFSEDMRFTRLQNTFIPIDSFYLSVKEPLKGSIIINHTKNFTLYVINGLNLKIGAKTTIDNLTFKIYEHRINRMRSKNIDSGFCASYVLLEDEIDNVYKTIKFVETKDLVMGFYVGSSIDTTNIRVTGTIHIEPLYPIIN